MIDFEVLVAMVIFCVITFLVIGVLGFEKDLEEEFKGAIKIEIEEADALIEIIKEHKLDSRK